MTPQEINMFGPTPAVLRMAYIWHCILYLRKDAVFHSVWESNICFILKIEIRKVAKTFRTGSLEDENSIVTSFLLSRNSMPPRGIPFS